MASGVRVPLPVSATLNIGQRVEVLVVQGHNGIELSVAPPMTPAAQSPQSGVSALIVRLLESLNAMTASNAASAANVIPSNIPLPEAGVRALLALFVSRGNLGADLATIAALVQQAVAAGVLVPQVAEEFLRQLRHTLGDDEKSLLETVKNAGQMSKRSVEAILASLLGGEESVEEFVKQANDILIKLGALNKNQDFLDFLEARGLRSVFQDAFHRFFERVSASHLQNLRALDLPYHFIELPMTGEGPIRSAQIHIFGEGGGTGRDEDSANATVILDVSTAILGDLWIRVAVTESSCVCHFRAEASQLVDVISSASKELVESLGRLGYDDVSVTASLWKGDRFEAIGEELGRRSGIDMQI